MSESTPLGIVVPGSFSEQQGEHKILRTQAWSLGMNQTLSGVSLEEGDTWPADSDYEIIRSSIVHDRESGARVAQVTAVKFLTE